MKNNHLSFYHENNQVICTTNNDIFDKIINNNLEDFKKEINKIAILEKNDKLLYFKTFLVNNEYFFIIYISDIKIHKNEINILIDNIFKEFKKIDLNEFKIKLKEKEFLKDLKNRLFFNQIKGLNLQKEFENYNINEFSTKKNNKNILIENQEYLLESSMNPLLFEESAIKFKIDCNHFNKFVIIQQYRLHIIISIIIIIFFLFII